MPQVAVPTGGNGRDIPEWADAVKVLASDKTTDADAAWRFEVAIVPTPSKGNVRSMIDAARGRMARDIGKTDAKVGDVEVLAADYIGSAKATIGAEASSFTLFRRTEAGAVETARKRVAAQAVK